MALYHFTDSRNVNSIMRHGLLSWPLIFKYDIDAILSSNELSRNLDSNKGLGPYVRLALKPSHKMLNRVLKDGTIQELVWLQIDDSILNNNGVLYSDTNAAANRATINYDWRNAFNNGDDQAEILIPQKISPNYIKIFN
jgi:hypothetical protein